MTSLPVKGLTNTAPQTQDVQDWVMRDDGEVGKEMLTSAKGKRMKGVKKVDKLAMMNGRKRYSSKILY